MGKKVIKIGIDLIMTALLIIQMAYLYIGGHLHEWMGLCLFGLFIVHHVLNLKWITHTTKGSYSPFRVVLTLTNAMIFLAMIGLIVSGLSMSRHVMPSLSFGIRISVARKIHMVSAYNGFILMSVHIGLHWASLASRMRKLLRFSYNQKIIGKIAVQTGAAAIAGYGLFALVKHDLLSYALLRKEFVFFDLQYPLPLFIIDYLAIMCFWIYSSHFLIKYMKILQKRRLEIRRNSGKGDQDS